MGSTVAIQTQCCLMKKEEYDEEDDVSDTERTEDGTTERWLLALCLGICVVAVIFMVRLLAALPLKCPDRSQKQPQLFLLSAAFKTQFNLTVWKGT